MHTPRNKIVARFCVCALCAAAVGSCGSPVEPLSGRVGSGHSASKSSVKKVVENGDAIHVRNGQRTSAPTGDPTDERINKALLGLRVGMSEAEVREAIKPHVIKTGTVYWGGTGARRIYFQISEHEQVWIEIDGWSDRVCLVGKREQKQEWIWHRGDSITIADGQYTSGPTLENDSVHGRPDK